MSYHATVFNVLIVSPGDVQMERNIVREVVHEWNAINSNTRKIVIQPISWETHSHPFMKDRAQSVLNEQILEDADLLVAIFWTRLGTPTGEAQSGSIEELERHLATGKPAMVYFSSAPVRLDSVDNDQYGALKAYREECRSRGLIDTYDSPSDSRQKFARQLAAKINTDDYFAVSEAGVNAGIAEVPSRQVPALSKEAKALPLEAVEDRNGQIVCMHLLGGVEIQTNGKQFVEKSNARSRAAWEGALKELVSQGLVQNLGNKGQIYQITREGYEMAETLRS